MPATLARSHTAPPSSAYWPKCQITVETTKWIRAERGGFLQFHVTAGDDFSAFLAMALNFDNREIVYGPLRFGYIAEQGENVAIVEAEMKSQRRDMHSLRTLVKFKDAGGRDFEALGIPLAAAPFHFNPSVVSYQTLMQWECGGKTGVSHLTDFLGLNFMSRGMSDKYSV